MLPVALTNLYGAGCTRNDYVDYWGAEIPTTTKMTINITNKCGTTRSANMYAVIVGS